MTDEVTGRRALLHHYPASMVVGAKSDVSVDAADDGPADPVDREVERICAAARRAGVLADDDENAGGDVNEAVEQMERLRRRHGASPS